MALERLREPLPRRRLLVICHGFPPYYGGAEHVAYYLAREAARTRDCEVRVITSDIGGRLPHEETMDGVAVLRLPARKKEWTRHTTPELLSFLWSARRHLPALVDRWRPDHVLAHFTLPAGAVALNVARRYRIPYSVVLHGSDVPGYQTGRFGAVYPLVRPWVRAIWTRAQQVIAVGEDLRNLAHQTWPAGNIVVIPNGVDIERFSPGERAAADRHDHRLTVVAVAQLIERKGLQFLLDALSRLAPSLLEKLDVHIYGTGSYEPALRSKTQALNLRSVVRFQGLAAHDSLPAVLREADVFVLPSLQEGLPLSLLEAMACGLPAIATAVGGIPSILRDHDNALVIPPGRAEELHRALHACLEDADLRSRLGAAARRTAERFSWRAVWKQYAQTLRMGDERFDADSGAPELAAMPS